MKILAQVIYWVGIVLVVLTCLAMMLALAFILSQDALEVMLYTLAALVCGVVCIVMIAAWAWARDRRRAG